MADPAKTWATLGNGLCPVTREVVGAGLCVGCGVCAAICPVSCLAMRFNAFGEYNPVESHGCTECGLCRRACPFGEGNPNETELARTLFGESPRMGMRSECGYYDTSFVGYSSVRDHRMNGASGGLLTWTLETLLARGMIDRVICASPHPDPERLFTYVVVDSPTDLRSCAKSCYYPLEMSSVIGHVLEHEGQYAVTGLPCFIKALRLAATFVPKLSQRLVFHAGIVCGQLPSKFYTEHVIRLAGQEPGCVRRVTYRDKDPNQPATHHLVAIRTDPDSPKPDARVPHLEGPCFAWENWFFKLDACNYCDDVFAEVADAVYMDAWLPEYSSRPGGDSLVISRKPEITNLIADGIRGGELAAREIPIERVIGSQRPVLLEKREGLSYRLYLRGRTGLRTPGKRVPPDSTCDRGLARWQEQHLAMQAESRQAWLNSRQDSLSGFLARIPTYQTTRRAKRFLALNRKVKSAIKRLLRRASVRR